MLEDYVLELIKEDKRVDGRKLDEYRKIEVETGLIERAEGSARVRFGETEVIVGVKLDVGEPFADTPNMGVLITNAEFSPVAHPEFEPGPPGEDAIELARVVDRGIREGKVINFEKLCIKEGEKVWIVYVDIQIVNHKGNLLDAASLATMLALLDAKLPKYDPETDTLDREVRTEEKLPIEHKVVTITVEKIAGKIVADAYIDEEKVSDARLTVGVREDGIICSMQKSGSGYFTPEEVERIIDFAIKKSKGLLSYCGG